MKKIVEREIDICDFCKETETTGSSAMCLNCGKSSCYPCGQIFEYSSGVHFGGTRNGRYCLPCKAELIANPTPLFAAYLEIANLRDEYGEFEERMVAAEANVKAEWKAAGHDKR